jgi:hypothetical protein
VLSPSQSTSPPLNRWIPHPPSVAPAVGDGAKPDSRCVHSIVFVGWPANNIVEAVAQSERLFAAELVPSGSGDPRSTATERPPSSRPADSRICLACQAHLGSRVAANLVVEVGEEGCMAMHRGDDGGSEHRIFGSSSPATSLLQRGCLPSKALRGAVAAARHWAVLAAGVVGIWRTYV